jgi:hypothetical protein
MNVTVLLLWGVLSQEAGAPPAPEAEPEAAKPAVEAMHAPAPARAPKGAEDVQKLLKRLPEMSSKERLEAIEKINRQFGLQDSNPVLPSSDVDLEKYSDLSEADQVKVSARQFFNELIAADTTAVVRRCGLPFLLEDRRIDRSEDLRAEWSKNLRSKRTDLLTLYDIEVLNAADMEKKHGRPPGRLGAWSLHTPGTWFAVGNLSGRPFVLMLREAGAAWQVIGYHD